jgi:hypothetical protein
LPPDLAVYLDHVPLLNADKLAMGLLLLALGAPPFASLLALGAGMMIRSLIARRECSPFLFGFLSCGSATLVGYIACLFMAPRWVEDYLEMLVIVLAFVPMEIVGSVTSNQMDEAITRSTFMTVLCLPQLLLALLGGWLNERYLRLTLKILPHASADSQHCDLVTSRPAAPP